MNTEAKTKATTQEPQDKPVTISLESCMPAALTIDALLDEMGLSDPYQRLGTLMGAVGLIYARYGSVLSPDSPSFNVAVETNQVARDAFEAQRAAKRHSLHNAPETQQ